MFFNNLIYQTSIRQQLFKKVSYFIHINKLLKKLHMDV